MLLHTADSRELAPSILAADLAHRHETKLFWETFPTRVVTRAATQIHAAGLPFTTPIGVERAQYAHGTGRLKAVALRLNLKRPDYHGILSTLSRQNLSLVLDWKRRAVSRYSG